MWNSWSLETHDTHKLALWCSAFSVPFNILAPQCRVCIQEGVPARKSHIYLPFKWPKNIKKCLTYVLAECHVWWYVNTGGLTVSLRKAAPVGEVGRGKGHQGGEDEEKKGEKGEGGERRRGIVTHDDSTCHPFWIKAHPSIYRSPFPLTITRIRFKNRNPPLSEKWLKAILNTDSGFDFFTPAVVTNACLALWLNSESQFATDRTIKKAGLPNCVKIVFSSPTCWKMCEFCSPGNAGSSRARFPSPTVLATLGGTSRPPRHSSGGCQGCRSRCRCPPINHFTHISHPFWLLKAGATVPWKVFP